MKDNEDNDIELALQAEQAQKERLIRAGLTGPQIARRVLEMVGALRTTTGIKSRGARRRAVWDTAGNPEIGHLY